ncbi:hypothetical protein H5410_008892 [Solanum commersonii]|uniref:Uncharacterized protein n=1 Tax=Solanum commersonii TaxID=4109 RepID=A0A9J6AHY1_SOLCO|nr:hypothetical protein H5410_008892 [Solanum commersonii]
MEAPLEVVRDKKTGDVLFYKRSHLPFKTVSLSIDSPKNSSIDVLPSKNEHVIASNFRNAAVAEQVSSNFGDNYGVEQNYLLLEEKCLLLIVEIKNNLRYWANWQLQPPHQKF